MESIIKRYDRAIELAGVNGFIQDEAIANERAARYFIDKGMENIGGVYLNVARRGYEKWGARLKVSELNREFSYLLTKTPVKETVIPDDSQSLQPEVSEASTVTLDYKSIVSSLQSISTEIVLEDLLDRLIRIVMKYVVLDDAKKEGGFTLDPYILKSRSKSICCLPVIRQSSLTGVLYLENTIAAGAFTPNRVEVLQLLASQAAISLQNAMLVREIRKAEEQLRNVLDGIIVFGGLLEIDGTVILANRVALKTAGLTPEDVVGKPFEETGLVLTSPNLNSKKKGMLI